MLELIATIQSTDKLENFILMENFWYSMLVNELSESFLFYVITPELYIGGASIRCYWSSVTKRGKKANFLPHTTVYTFVISQLDMRLYELYYTEFGILTHL